MPIASFARLAALARRPLARRADARPPLAYDPAWEPADQPRPTLTPVRSQACTRDQIAEPAYAAWCEVLGQPVMVHRKQWEWVYILAALDQEGMLAPDRRGLGFGVGTEPITAVAAARGCTVVATDLPAEDGTDHERWAATGQHAADLAALNAGGWCPDDLFAERVSFRPVDMNHLPTDLEGFDFLWSSCALEHLGDLEAGWRFVHASLGCLRPGGVAVHTTELNVSSNTRTVQRGHTVAYRRRDVERLVAELRRAGHEVTTTFALGDTPDDRTIDRPPWKQPHLKIELDRYVITSFGLLVRKR